MSEILHNVMKLRALWCAATHDAPMWPIHGQYRCRTCGRSYLVPWAAADIPSIVGHSAVSSTIAVD
jgi:hypothetical protein